MITLTKERECIATLAAALRNLLGLVQSDVPWQARFARDAVEALVAAYEIVPLAGSAPAPLPEKPLCISCGEPATEKAGKGGGTGSDLCARCWRDEFSDPAEGD